MSAVDHERDLDDAIAATFDEHEPGRIVTEWLLIAVTQSADELAGSSMYAVRNRPGMLHHHVRGLIDSLDTATTADFEYDEDDD